MNKHILIVFATITVFFYSCTKDPNPSDNRDYSKGSFIVNEGEFQSGTGTITYFDGNSATQDIFGQQNNGAALGNICQSMIKFGDKYFIAVNNADKIEVVNAADFKSIATIANVSYPRYFATDDKKLYVTSWNKDFATGAIIELDPINFKVIKSIPINGLVEKMIFSEKRIYATVSTLPTDVLAKQIIVVNPNTNTLSYHIEIGDNTNDLVEDQNGTLWVLCSGFSDWSDPSLNTDGSLNWIGDAVHSIKVANGAKGLVIDKAGQNLYYLAAGKVWHHDISSSEPQAINDLSGSYYSIGLNKNTGDIYLADAGDFQKSGIITVFNPNTKVKTIFNAGIIPSFFYFAE